VNQAVLIVPQLHMFLVDLPPQTLHKLPVEMLINCSAMRNNVLMGTMQSQPKQIIKVLLTFDSH